MFLSFVPSLIPSVPLAALKITTVLVVATALAHQLHHALQYPGQYLDDYHYWSSTSTTSSHAPVATTTTTTTPVVPAFGACLLVKDDNALLSEWLAYHYTVLPLRYLMIGVDVNSTQDPYQDVLQEWHDTTDLQVLHVLQAEDFAHTHDTSKRGTQQQQERIATTKQDHHHALVNRQKGFITECSKRMKEHGLRWTAYLDTDEYVVPHRLVVEDNNHDVTTEDTASKTNTAETTIKPESRRIRSSLPPLSSPTTVLDVMMDLQRQGLVDACYTLPRLLVGALQNRTCHREATAETETTTKTPSTAASSLQTLHYFQHAPKGDFQYSKFGKVFMDVGRLPESTLHDQIPKSIHRPYKDACGPGVVPFFDAYFYINHYIGSWERYSSRPDGRRNRQEWEQRAFVDDGSPDCNAAGMEGWWQRFQELVGGPETAARLVRLGTDQRSADTDTTSM